MSARREPKKTDFEKLLEASPALLLILEPDLTIVAVSDAYLKATMTVREKICGKGLFEVFPDNPDDPTADGTSNLRASLDRVLTNRVADTMAVQKYDIRRPESEGGGFEVRYWSPDNSPVLDSNGEVIYLIHRVEDVTKLVTQVQERKVIEEQRDLFFNYSQDLLAIAGTDGYFKRVNPAFERLLGYTEKEFCAKPLVEFLHPDDVAKTVEGITVLAAGVPTVASKNRYRCKDGTYRWLSWNTTPMGSTLYTVGRDITGQMQSEERIRQLNQELERKNEGLERKVRERVAELQASEAQVQQLQKMDAVGRLAGGVAHDFNNMLGAITMYCDLLADDAEDPELLKGHIQDIRLVSDRGAALTRQLLIFSRKQIIQPQTVHLNPLILQLKKMLARLIGEQNEIIAKLSPDLKTVRVDPSQMEQVLMNLVVNARDAMKDGGKVTIETANVYLDEAFTSTHLTVEPGYYVLLSVSDTGHGMDLLTQSKIFEPFFTTKAVGKGTGLGLTTTYGIVKQSKGTIWVYSEPGKGTVFKVYLPIIEEVAETQGVESSPSPIVRGTRTILVVEDDEKLREGFSRVLRRKGYEVLAVDSGKEALHILGTRREAVHLLLTDVVMPGLNGFELAKKSLEACADLRVLYMSGYTSDAFDTSEADFTQAMNFIQKPFSASTLVLKVEEVLSG